MPSHPLSVKYKPVPLMMLISLGVAWAPTSQTRCWRTRVAQKSQTGNPLTITGCGGIVVLTYLQSHH